MIISGILILLYLLFPEMDRNIFVVLVMIFVLYLFLEKDNLKPLGKIYFDNHSISVVSNEHDFKIELSNLDKLELVYGGYRGQRTVCNNIGRYYTFSGYDNYLEITSNGNKFECRFMVDDFTSETNLLELLKNWEHLGYDISNINIKHASLSS